MYAEKDNFKGSPSLVAKKGSYELIPQSHHGVTKAVQSGHIRQDGRYVVTYVLLINHRSFKYVNLKKNLF